MKIDLSRFSGRYRQETRDNLAQFDVMISKLESDSQADSADRNTFIREMMRLIHAIKGGARMLGFAAINQLCHATEEMLISLKDRSEIVKYDIDLIVEARKGIDRLLLQTHGEADTTPQKPVWLDRLIGQLISGEGNINNKEGQSSELAKKSNLKAEESSGTETPWKADSWRDATVRVDVNSIDDLLYYGRELTQALDGLRKGQLQIAAIREKLEGTVSSRRKSDVTAMGLTIGEADALLRSLTKTAYYLRDKIAEVDRNVRQIDSGAVELRMRPIAELFETIPLQVRDLSRSLGKEVDVELSGESVRLDGRIVELLREPLLHIIRNAVDHGIENPEVRKSSGKTPRGRVTLGAYENAGWARIVIADDGAGIEPDVLWNRAILLGIVDRDDPRGGDQKSITNLLFDDRFTSRVSASDVSGRGVGLGAVKRRLQELRGNVTIESIPGMGTRFILLMPTSLSSQHVLVTSIHFKGEQRFYAFPTAMIKGTSRFEPTLEDSIDNNGGDSEGETIRSVSLSGLLGGKRSRPISGENYLVHCSDGNNSAAFAVEQIVAEIEIIIEPLPQIARSAEIIAGAAPLTADEIALVLNIPTILTYAASSATWEYHKVEY